ncbi:hypothetical protein DBR24_26130 [Pseudomonas sp. HMWF006]|nr:hypothetical protein DBR24_26130 [Pseudomonas sp. HMWF006]PTT60616.1 hypothetical protein DBR26_28880 [Pseudomonas sp. HMWF007]PTT89635.1 hypothetical protein DBR29_15210 [Pseudomonas sp. HMWF005]
MVTKFMVTEVPCGSWLASDRVGTFSLDSRAFVKMNNKRPQRLCSGQASMRGLTGSMRSIGTGEFA